MRRFDPHLPQRGTAMSRWMTGLLFTIGLVAIVTGHASLQATESSVKVICHGKLRCGMVAVGGETTGTNLSLNGLTWELQIADAKLKAFAESNHHKLVTATGTLQHVKGPERSGRWVVAVNTLTARDPKIKEDSVSITARGTLEKGPKSSLKLKTDDFTWTITPPDDAQLVKKLESLDSRSVTLKGEVDCPKSKNASKNLKIIPSDVKAD